MQKFKIILFSLLLVSTQVYVAIGGNPFDRSTKNTIGTNVPWQYIKDTAVKVSEDSLDSSTYYHLTFNGKSLRLSLSSSSSTNTAQDLRHYEQFTVKDVKVDGQRLPLFQWCLSHQEQRGDFLQQGLSVKNGVCENRGENGTFVMHLDKATLNALKTGKTLSFVIKPFRTTVILNYSLAGFAPMADKIAAEQAPPKPVKKAVSTAAPAAVTSTCFLRPPAGFGTLKPIKYTCDSVVEKSAALKSMKARIGTIEKKRAAEKEVKRKAELAKKKKEEEALRQRQLQQKQEAAAIAASELRQKQLNKEITTRMVAMCKKMWAQGQSPCYCGKYIDKAPPNIKPNPGCKSAKH